MASTAHKHADRELLPTNVIPRNYKVTLEPDLTSFIFKGDVSINLEVAEDTSSVKLNTLELDIHHARITASGITADITGIGSNAHDQTTTFALSSALPAASAAILSISFTGQLNDKMAGFYRSTHKRDDGTIGVLATTQMAATDCRRAFPCFDEPALKATFDISLIADKHLTCISNMPVVKEEEVKSQFRDGFKKLVCFDKSPLMSTYLVAFVVGELNYVECNDFRVPVRTYAPNGYNIEDGRFSAKLAAKTLAFYEKAFGVEFPLPKMDQIAIPDFLAGAMENWGLIEYRVVDLLLNEATTGAVRKERVAEVIQHELAHQWFGNLVTMDWWEGLWLNEGFATWASWYSCDSFYPEWKVWQTYVVDTLQSALSLDSLRSSHPIEAPIRLASEVNEIFDDISYAKGSCVLRMISSYLGEDVFLEGVRSYLNKFAYGCTQTTDLWECLETTSGKPVTDMMTTWTKKVGFPVVSVTENPEKGFITVKQNRFLRTGDVKPEEDDTLYPISLALRTREGVDSSLVLRERSAEIRLPDHDFFKLNANHTGLFRTLYTPDRLKKLADAASRGQLPVEDRAGLISDAGALTVAGHLPTTAVLSLLAGFGMESEFVVWSEMLSQISAIQRAWVFEDAEVKEALEKFKLWLVSQKSHEIGWEFSTEDSHVGQQFKALLFEAAGMSGDEEVLNAARSLFAKYVAGNEEAVHPNIRRAVFAITLKFGGEEEFNKSLELYRKSNDTDERNNICRVFGTVRSPNLIQKALGLFNSPDVKDQDVYMPVAGLRGHDQGIAALWKYVSKNWDEIVARFPASGMMLGTIVGLSTGGFTQQEQLDEVTKFFAGKDTTGYTMVLKQSKDSIMSKIMWTTRDAEEVRKWLKKERI